MTPQQELFLHVLETAPAVHPERRAIILRALADIIGDERFAAQLIARAEACEALQREDGQLSLAFASALTRARAEAPAAAAGPRHVTS